MKIIADMHTHTIVSGHAHSTLAENCRVARQRGHTHIAMTDHGPAMPGGPDLVYFFASTAPKYAEGVRIIRGVEANIVGGNGELDIPEPVLGRLEFVIASMHEICWAPSDYETHTKAWLSIVENPHVDCLGHIGNANYAFDMETVLKKCAGTGKMIEINNHSFDVRRGSRENCGKAALLCMEYGVPVVVTTDAHFMDDVGVFGYSLELLDDIGFPEELVLNADTERLRRHFKEHLGIEI
jgi:putative hydrolase